MTPGNADPDVLFDYPAAAAVGMKIDKTRIVAASRPSRAVQQRLTAEVLRVTWAYKLAPLTVNLPVRPAGGPHSPVAEIQVFAVVLKDPDAQEVSADVLRAIDAGIPSPLIFEVTAGQRTYVAGATKRPSGAGGGKWVVGESFRSDWRGADGPRVPLPAAVDLGNLHDQLLRRLIPVPTRAGEPVREHAERAGRAVAALREIEKLEKRVTGERQYNRKVEINSKLRELRAQYEVLTQPPSPS